MELNPKNNIKDPKVRAYFEDITEGKEPSVRLSADELEKGINQFDEGMKKALAEGDEMIIRAKMGEMAKALSLSYIAQKYFGKSRAWLMQKVNGNTVNGKTAAFTESERQKQENLCYSDDNLNIFLGEPVVMTDDFHSLRLKLILELAAAGFFLCPLRHNSTSSPYSVAISFPCRNNSDKNQANFLESAQNLRTFASVI